MGEIISQFDMVRKTFRETPCLVYFRNAELVEGCFGVNACTWVSVGRSVVHLASDYCSYLFQFQTPPSSSPSKVSKGSAS